MEVGKDKDGLHNRASKNISGYDTISVVVNHLTKSPHFLAIKETDKMEKLTRTYLGEIFKLHVMPIYII